MTKNKALIFLAIILVIYLAGAFKIDLMDLDTTQYMTIAGNMHNSGDYLTVKWRDDFNYLDKPPLLFWLSSFFFSFLGVTPFAYRLPSILVNLLGIFSTYKLGKRLYTEKTGLLSAIIYSSSLGIFIINHDVRTDTLLTGFTIFSIWQLYNYLQDKKNINFILGFIGIGLAILTKGPIGIIVPILTLGPHLIYHQRWKDIFNPAWLIGVLIIFVVLIPMIISVTTQHGMEGIRFHFWSQSFGRITGESNWKDTTGLLYFLHTFLWSFIPWSIFALAAYYDKLKSTIRLYKASDKEEVFTLSGFTLVMILMSLASYKLPHYIYVVFPLISIITGRYLVNVIKPIKREGLNKIIYFSQFGFNILLWIIAFTSFIIFKVSDFYIYLIIFAVFGGFIFSCFYNKAGNSRIINSTVITMIGVALVMNIHFYPELSKYQARVFAGRYISDKNIEKDKILIFPLDVHKPTIDVYSGMEIPRSNHFSSVDSLLAIKKQLYIFTNNEGLGLLNDKQYELHIEKTYKDYQISMLGIAFLNPVTRENTLSNLYLLKVNR